MEPVRIRVYVSEEWGFSFWFERGKEGGGVN
jgi:hypothetical protein